MKNLHKSTVEIAAALLLLSGCTTRGLSPGQQHAVALVMVEDQLAVPDEIQKIKSLAEENLGKGAVQVTHVENTRLIAISVHAMRGKRAVQACNRIAGRYVMLSRGKARLVDPAVEPIRRK
jgi:tartrate dehydratase beta subunit/fumarate hydratase class I family protein